MHVAGRWGCQGFCILFFIYNGASCTKNFSVTEILGSASHAAAALLHMYLVTASLRNNVFLKAINKWWRWQGSESMPFWTQVTAFNRGSWYTAASSVLPMILKHSLDYVTYSLSSPPPPLPSSPTAWLMI